MLLGRMVLDRERRLSPIVEQIVVAPFRQRRMNPVGKTVDPVRRRIVRAVAAKFRQIVREAAAADDQHAFLPQRRQRAPDAQVMPGPRCGWTESCSTGMSACGYINSNGTQAP